MKEFFEIRTVITIYGRCEPSAGTRPPLNMWSQNMLVFVVSMSDCFFFCYIQVVIQSNISKHIPVLSCYVRCTHPADKGGAEDGLVAPVMDRLSLLSRSK